MSSFYSKVCLLSTWNSICSRERIRACEYLSQLHFALYFHVHHLIYLINTIIELVGRYYHHAHFVDEETEVQERPSGLPKAQGAGGEL